MSNNYENARMIVEAQLSALNELERLHDESRAKISSQCNDLIPRSLLVQQVTKLEKSRDDLNKMLDELAKGGE